MTGYSYKFLESAGIDISQLYKYNGFSTGDNLGRYIGNWDGLYWFSFGF